MILWESRDNDCLCILNEGAFLEDGCRFEIMIICHGFCWEMVINYLWFSKKKGDSYSLEVRMEFVILSMHILMQREHQYQCITWCADTIWTPWYIMHLYNNHHQTLRGEHLEEHWILDFSGMKYRILLILFVGSSVLWQLFQLKYSSKLMQLVHYISGAMYEGWNEVQTFIQNDFSKITARDSRIRWKIQSCDVQPLLSVKRIPFHMLLRLNPWSYNPEESTRQSWLQNISNPLI